LALLGAATLVVVSFVSLTLGKQQFHPVNTRLLAGWGGTSLIVLAICKKKFVMDNRQLIFIAFAGGFSLVVGLPFSMITMIAVFLMLAIGVDDVFVLVHGFEIARTENPVRYLLISKY